MKKTWLFWTAVACIIVGIILICIVLFSLIRRQPTVPFPESPLPTPTPIPIVPRVYLPLMAKNHPQPIEHGLAGQGSCEQMQELNIDWYYNWSPQTSLDCLEFVPMIWESNLVGSEIPPDAEWLAGFNECGVWGQCPDTPCEAAIGWRNMEQTYPDVKLLSPATLGWYGVDWHLGWLEEWHDCYVTMYDENPRLDAVAAHCYGSDIFCQGFLEDVVDYVDTIGGYPIWVTEFANPPMEGVSYQQTLDSMETMVSWFKSSPRIERWGWFALTYRGDEPWLPDFWIEPYSCLVDYDTHELTGCGELYRALH